MALGYVNKISINMKKLIIHKHKLNKVVDSLEKDHHDLLLIEVLLSIVWSYRKGENGMYYSNEQLAEQCRKSEATIKRHMKYLREQGLIDTKRRYNSSSIIKPSQKFINMMGEKDRNDPTGKITTIPYTSSKEEEDRNTNEVFAFLEANPHLKKAYENQKGSFGEERANNTILKLIKNKKEKV